MFSKHIKFHACTLLLFIGFWIIHPAYANEKIIFTFNGIENEILKNAQKRLNVVSQSYAPLTTQKINLIYKQASKEIREALRPYGYFHAGIDSTLTRNKNIWTAEFSITLHEPIRVSNFVIGITGEGKDNQSINKFINHLPLQIGDIFRADAYEKVKESLFQIAINNGYIHAQFTTNEIVIDPNHNLAKIKLILNTGDQYYFGKVHFQQTPFSNIFLKRFISFNESMPFSSEKLLSVQQTIAHTVYFQKVLMTPDLKKTKDHHVPIDVYITAPKAKKYSVGVGYGTYTGPRLTTNVSFRRLTDMAQHLDAQLKLSSVLSGLGIKYYIPGKNPVNDEWLMGVNYQRFLPKNGSSSSGKITAGYTTKIKATEANIDLNYLTEQYKVKHQKPEHTQLLYPNLNFIYSKSDDLLNPTFGQSINLTLRGASSTLLSSTSFLQTEIKTKYFFSPFNSTHIILRTNLGYTVVKDLNKLPLSMRFFAGGLNSIRGYSESHIGPGRYLYTGSIEYQHRIYGNWWGAIFCDAGDATNHFENKLYYGKGLGIIYTSLMGPIKVYAGQGTHLRKNNYAFELSIGPEF